MTKYKAYKVIFAFLTGFIVLSCSELNYKNPLKYVEEQLSYEKDIKPIFSNQCIKCHSGDSPAGNYDLSSILKIIGNGSDHLPNVIIGSQSSLLLVKITSGIDNHNEYIGSNENFQKLYRWIVVDSLSITEPIVHLAGPMDVNSPNFHGQDIRQKAWSMESCKLCHGADYGGGSSESSCNKCHHPNPEDCLTCHGGLDNNSSAPPPDLNNNTNISSRGIGAHTLHLNNIKIANKLKCEECHIITHHIYDVGHVDSESPAEVVFSGMALHLNAEPYWDPETLTCKNVYCHGNFPSGNRNYAPKWTEFNPNSTGCSPSCHGLPPIGPTRTGFKHTPKVPECWICHTDVIDKENNFYDISTHINGESDR